MRERGRSPLRAVRPAVEGLEQRLALSQAAAAVTPDTAPFITGRQIDKLRGIPFSDRRIDYRTPGGTHIIVTLYGIGTLAGSSVNPDGSLNLVYSGTTSGTRILGFAGGGDHQALIRSILPASAAAQGASGVGGTPLSSIRLSNFVLEDGGIINETAGLHILQLYAIGANTQVNVRELPTSTSSTTSSNFNQNGTTLNYSFLAGLLRSLNSTSGEFVAGEGLLYADTFASNGVPNNGPPAPPPGMVLLIKHVFGPPRASSALPDPQVFGYDPTANALIRFDALNGAALQTIPLPASAIPYSGVALARDNGVLVALVGNGSRVFAFNALTGAAMGSFDTSNIGFNTVDGIGSTDIRTVIEDAGSGLLRMINVTASLGSGEAVPIGKPFSPTPPGQYAFAGGLTGVAGSNALFATVSAHFNTFQPDVFESGIVAVSTTGDVLSGGTPTALKQGANYVKTGPALGSVDQQLAVVTGVSNGKNTVALYGTSLAPHGTITLDDPNLLTGLSESFRPELANAAIIDVQGNIQSYQGVDARGLVLNDIGNLNVIKLHRAVDTTIVGEPFGHPDILHRDNVTIISTARSKGDVNGVTVEPGLRAVGPLAAPLPGLAGVRGPVSA